MAKLSVRRRPKINFLRLQLSAALNQSAPPSVISGLSSVFPGGRMARRRDGSFANWTLATAPNSHSGADIASNGRFDGRVDVPITQNHRRRERWFGLGRGAQKARTAND